MKIGFNFFINSILLGIGLAMDAFSVSLANGLNEQNMKKGKICGIAGTFAFFQGLMPLIGWICVKTVVDRFAVVEKFIPWIALVLLLFIGIKMIVDGVKNKDEEQKTVLGVGALIVQGIATSIDALSVGFVMAEYSFWQALIAIAIIMVITFGLCVAGVFIGKKFGTKLAGKATVVGGIILILIGLEIFLTGILS
ncbi:MAG: manganese efflux pump [Clostridiales bacterium]|mgnify:CR=1 FL=1|nr:manganese efflux pump [Clostridiales bacterium]